ncbi:N-glycosylase/DNA lyase 8-oxoguanine DNA glycosylase [Channa argus]|uniref:N-glycosylase/DNA lyase n=1 Tax=Channa argus TaxID=215402 RepID=A0A6G1Q3S0_CHAAH|nr:N-glycosylase/DNA lyase 8-oxoguanine DNA glycosylase [Channa argus]
MGGRVWTLTQTDDTLWYHVYNNQDREKEGNDRKRRASVSLQEDKSGKRSKGTVKSEEEPVPVTEQDTEVEENMLRNYFQLNVELRGMYSAWGKADPHFKCIAEIFRGVRMLRQDPTECLFSIICTTNNNISRIQGMVEKMCQTLGTELCQLDETTYHDFPQLSAIADSTVEECLKDLGFGYRAKFVQRSAKQILDTHGLQWLEGLRNVPYPQARDALLTLPGVGNKVADCVCLMSLDKAEAVPIDTHMWQIAKRDYNYAAGRNPKTLTDKLYQDLGDFFRQLWGLNAGWAQSVLFCADLKQFQYLKQMPHVKQLKEEEEK